MKWLMKRLPIISVLATMQVTGQTMSRTTSWLMCPWSTPKFNSLTMTITIMGRMAEPQMSKAMTSEKKR